MTKYEIRWSHQARKFHQGLEKIYEKRFKRMIAILEENPYHYAKAIKRLSGGLSGLYRFRIGKLRIFYTIMESEKVVHITNIDTRGDAY